MIPPYLSFEVRTGEALGFYRTARGGKASVTHGPFAEIKECLAGF